MKVWASQPAPRAPTPPPVFTSLTLTVAPAGTLARTPVSPPASETGSPPNTAVSVELVALISSTVHSESAVMPLTLVVRVWFRASVTVRRWAVAAEISVPLPLATVGDSHVTSSTSLVGPARATLLMTRWPRWGWVSRGTDVAALDPGPARHPPSATTAMDSVPMAANLRICAPVEIRPENENDRPP